MGSTRWDDEHYASRASLRAATGEPTFAHDASVAKAVWSALAAGDYEAADAAKKAHKTLDPFGVKLRESRDSDVHPTARAIATLLDVTGSMLEIPKIEQKTLPKLMGLLTGKGYLEHPAILTGAIGDATCDRVPLQMGQFESGIEIENDLTNLYLEAGGGGQNTESYELALYFMARHTVTDCWEKRQEKGYIFITGDERPYSAVSAAQVKKVIGDNLQGDISIEEIVSELKERWHIFYIMPKMTNHFGDENILRPWRKLLGQNVILLEDPNGVSQCIATQIGVCEGKIDGDDAVEDMIAAGTDKMVAKAVGRALVPAGSGGRAKGTDIAVPDSGGGSGIATL